MTASAGMAARQQATRCAPATVRAPAARSISPRNDACSSGLRCATARPPNPRPRTSGPARVQAKNWRLAFFGTLALSGGLAAGLVWQSARGTVTPWVVVLRQNWLDAYNYVTDKGALALNDYARRADPFAEIGKKQVAVEVSSVIRASPSSFRVAWIASPPVSISTR